MEANNKTFAIAKITIWTRRLVLTVSKRSVAIGSPKPESIIKSKLNKPFFCFTCFDLLRVFVCVRHRLRYLDVKEELDDFTEGSRQLEAELEASLEQKEKTVRDLKQNANQLQHENESLHVSSRQFLRIDP